MADPASALAAVSIGSTIAGGVVGATGASQTANANAQAFTYKAGIAQLNQQIAGQNASWALNSGGIKQQEEGMKDAGEIAQTKVVQAASGLDVNTGTGAAVRQTQTDVAKFNQGIIAADAAHTAYGYEVEAVKQGAEASMDTAAADNARKAGDISVLSSILGTVSSVSSKWSQANTLGIGSSKPGPIGTFDPDNWGAQPTWST